MEVPKDFSTRMTALAEDIPTQVIAGLLRKFLPRQPVSTRQARPAPAGQAERQPRGFAPPVGDGPRKVRRAMRSDRRRIVLTAKGQRKLSRNGTDGATANLFKMRDAETVRDCVPLGLTSADINYALKMGTIDLEEN